MLELISAYDEEVKGIPIKVIKLKTDASMLYVDGTDKDNEYETRYKVKKNPVVFGVIKAGPGRIHIKTDKGETLEI